MDQKAIGEYIKRLRLNAKYTQIELGERLNVTDKAISRWESGMGMPEIGNLVVISKLFGVTVDDILNCNEAVFSAPPPCARNENTTTAEESRENNPADESRNENAEPTVDESREKNPQPTDEPDRRARPDRAGIAACAPSRKFAVILLISYLSFGMLAASFQPSPVCEFIVPYILLSVFVLSCAVLALLAKLIPEKIYFIVSFALQAASIVMCIVLGGMICAYVGEETGGNYYFSSDEVAPLSAATALFVFALLFAVRLLYTLGDMTKDAENKKITNLFALGLCAAAVVLSVVVSALTTFFERLTGVVNISMTVCSVAASVFALKQLFASKGLDILNTVLLFGLCGVCLVLAVLGQFMPVESIVRMDNLYPYFFLCALALASPATFSVWQIAEGKASELSARRITAVVSIILLLPMMYYGFDIFALDILLGHSAHAAAAWLRIAVFIAAVLYFSSSCEIGKLFKNRIGKKKKSA